LDEISTQYNPDRFAQYKSVHDGAYDIVLKMSESPHCKLLREYEEKGEQVWKGFKKSPYYRMQRKFGKRKKRAIAKAKSLIELYESIKRNGFKGRIKVIDKPIVPNPFSSGFEIYDGHHRVACCLVLGMESLPATVFKAVSVNSDGEFRSQYTGVTDCECADCVTYLHCKECEARGDSSFRRCQRTLEKQYYSSFEKKDVLEIGCGTKEKGGFIKKIAEENGCRWTGVDILETDLATHVCSVEKMPFADESFDCVIASQAFEHWSKPDKALRELKRVLRGSGVASLTAPVHLHGHKNFVSGSFDQVQEIIHRNGFQIEKFETWRRNHSELPVYHLDDYNKKHLRKAGVYEYDNIEKYMVHFLLTKPIQ